MDYLKGSKRIVKPMAQQVSMGPNDGRGEYSHNLAQIYADGYKAGKEAGYEQARQELKGDHPTYTQAEIIALLESEEYASRHGKTVAKDLREEWGVE